MRRAFPSIFLRNCPGAGRRHSLDPVKPLAVSKEESFVTDDRGSDAAAKLVLAQLRFCQVAASTKGIVAGIEDVVAEIFIERTNTRRPKQGRASHFGYRYRILFAYRSPDTLRQD
jgi:hypothetical protein